MDIATAPARRPAVKKVPAKITRVETIPLRIAFRSPHKIASGAARTSAEFLLVRLHTDQELIGIGETQAWRRHGSAETLASQTLGNPVRVVPEHHDDLLDARSQESTDNAADERVGRPEGQQGLGAAHSGGQTGGEDDGRDHEGRFYRDGLRSLT